MKVVQWEWSNLKTRASSIRLSRAMNADTAQVIWWGIGIEKLRIVQDVDKDGESGRFNRTKLLALLASQVHSDRHREYSQPPHVAQNVLISWTTCSAHVILWPKLLPL